MMTYASKLTDRWRRWHGVTDWSQETWRRFSSAGVDCWGRRCRQRPRLTTSPSLFITPSLTPTWPYYASDNKSVGLHLRHFRPQPTQANYWKLVGKLETRVVN